MHYGTVSRILRGFSANALTRSAYRSLGNLRNSLERDSGIKGKYFYRSPLLLDMLGRHGVLRPGIEVLELGTGWVHWEALLLRNEVPCRAILCDVWDNRSELRLRRYLAQLAQPEVRARLGLSDPCAARLMHEAAEAPGLDGIYRALGFRYLLDATGKLAGVPRESVDVLVSSDRAAT
jgi:hypothetical protein